MTTETNVFETTGAPKKPAKKATKKAVKKVTKKAPKKAEERAPRAKKEGLRKGQERILKLLNKVKKPLTRAVIAEKAPVDVATCCEYLGSRDDEKRIANDEKHFMSLISLGFVGHSVDEEQGVVYTITPKGKTAAAKIE